MSFALDLNVSQEHILNGYRAGQSDKDLFSSGMIEDNLMDKNKVCFLEEVADEAEIARTKRFSFGQADNRENCTEIDANETSYAGTESV